MIGAQCGQDLAELSVEKNGCFVAWFAVDSISHVCSSIAFLVFLLAVYKFCSNATCHESRTELHLYCFFIFSVAIDRILCAADFMQLVICVVILD